MGARRPPKRAGDQNAFGDLVAVHSRELQVHCNRILGSLQDAEDALQETWCPRGGPAARYETTEAISLAFITALQLLPPRQRAVLILRDVLGYHASEVARMLDATQESVQSALKRARATVDNNLADTNTLARQPDSVAEHRLVARLTDALERADLDALIDLLAADVRLSMPPVMLEYRGTEAARRVLAAVTFRPGLRYRVIPTRANTQPAVALYLADPHTPLHHAYSLLSITATADHITALTCFTPELLPHFGLPRTLPATDRP
ncbi:sigma factor-like helix-turn-helix DNA-binding protein [Nocardia yunnanensis]|uniref:sigma factor-like helix-turn-helix DNA-binding protein n=1 Tax=Nocardia yunnanensis TaxID=2382165 RepID=UPI001FE4EDF2|nr:sigma factor-like helix-turn-helix DNA-binding protein [Nocardia yunnanensis]